ncbi:MAG: hypothetical protein ACRCWP_06850 [Shewanella sp.]
MNSISYPESIKSIALPANDFAQAMIEQVRVTQTRLDALPALHSPSPLSEQASQLQGLSDELMQLQCQGVSLCVTPYQYGVGLNGTLSADTALAFAAQQLLNEAAYSASGLGALVHGVALVVTAPTQSQFASRLSAVTDVLAFPQWLALSNLAAKHAVLAIERAQIPKARPAPYWQAINVSDCAPLHPINDTLSKGISVTGACATNAVSPVERLTQLAQKQVDRLALLQKHLQSLNALFSEQVYATTLSGLPAVMAKQLRDFRTDNQPHSTVLIVLCDTPPVFLNEALGL